jgi:hypothetical protein
MAAMVPSAGWVPASPQPTLPVSLDTSVFLFSSPPKRISPAHLMELLLYDYEYVQSPPQPNYCFWLTPAQCRMSCYTTFNFTDEHISILLIPLSKSCVSSIWTKHWGVYMASSQFNVTTGLDPPTGQIWKVTGFLWHGENLVCTLHCPAWEILAVDCDVSLHIYATWVTLDPTFFIV